MANTLIQYSYIRENVRKRKTEVIAGELSEDDLERIGRSLKDGSLFIPDQVGLPSLADSGEDDHIWHKMNVEDIKRTALPVTVNIKTEDFVDSMIQPWNPAKATERLFGAENKRPGMRPH